MDYTEIITMIIQLLLVPLATWAVVELRKWVLARTTASQIETALMLAERSITAAVSTTAQTFVDELKASGEWSPDAARVAADKALQLARRTMSDSTMEILRQVTGDANAWIKQRIEEAVRDDKSAIIVAPVKDMEVGEKLA